MFQSIEYIESRTSTGHQPITQKSIKIKRSINKIYKTPTAAATIQDRKKKKTKRRRNWKQLPAKKNPKGRTGKSKQMGELLIKIVTSSIYLKIKSLGSTTVLPLTVDDFLTPCHAFVKGVHFLSLSSALFL